MNLFAVDPGGTSGLAWVEVDGRPKEGSWQDVVKQSFENHTGGYAEVGGPEHKQVYEIVKQIQAAPTDIVIIERFILPPHTRDRRSAFLSPERIGFAIHTDLNRIEGGPKVIYQNPSDIGVITNERLRRWGLWVPGMKDARAAIKHLLIWLRRNGETLPHAKD